MVADAGGLQVELTADPSACVELRDAEDWQTRKVGELIAVALSGSKLMSCLQTTLTSNARSPSRTSTRTATFGPSSPLRSRLRHRLLNPPTMSRSSTSLWLSSFPPSPISRLKQFAGSTPPFARLAVLDSPSLLSRCVSSGLCARNAGSSSSLAGNLDARTGQRSRLDSYFQLSSSRLLGRRLVPRPRLVAIPLRLDRPHHSFRSPHSSRRQAKEGNQEQGQGQGEGGRSGRCDGGRRRDSPRRTRAQDDLPRALVRHEW